MSGRGRTARRRQDATPSEPALSVVVVTYDEADRIEACLDAVFECCRQLDPLEVVVVDSRSTDGTVELAAQYPVDVFRLPPTPDPTPGAGRYVGTRHTAADRILFVDGDAILEPSWLGAATDRLGADPGVAGVDGYLNEPGPGEERTVSALRGVALYDRAALASVGGFDPHLQSLEDVELGFRLRAAGYRLIRLSSVAATHPFDDGLGELRRRWQSGYYQGRGQLLRKGLGDPRTLLWTLYYSRLYVAVTGWLLAGLAATGASGGIGGVAWLALTGTAIAGALRRRSWRWTARKILGLGPVYAGAVLGFLGSHPPASAYPVDAVELVTSTPLSIESGGTP